MDHLKSHKRELSFWTTGLLNLQNYYIISINKSSYGYEESSSSFPIIFDMIFKILSNTSIQFTCLELPKRWGIKNEIPIEIPFSIKRKDFNRKILHNVLKEPKQDSIKFREKYYIKFYPDCYKKPNDICDLISQEDSFTISCCVTEDKKFYLYRIK